MFVPWAVTLFVSLLFFPQSPAATERTAHRARTVRVEVVDPGWLPTPGITVTVMRQGDRKSRQMGTTGVDGTVACSVLSGVKYDIEAAAVGFKTGRIRSVSLGTVTEYPPGTSIGGGEIIDTPAHVQIRLRISGPMMTVFD